VETSRPKYEKYVFVCANVRGPGERVSCGGSSVGGELAETLKAAVKTAGASGRIRVSKTQCLNVCQEGPNILIYPDNLWLKKVGLSDIPDILAILGIQP
jgi:(2Fe-2S) ferredoxin